ncbi:NAD(P)H-binding protein [Amycolatopsis oliviviridis]|uniref:Nucleotide-diphosphate-sugar epimerase n=1 Tax=Amycolatopsis oliviviridis TaxID=1471590 RepID=A0ABQ3LFC3_9PSEU|nr:NAD(P)H-binding protein [Amycolatopsis oliviviridis]GHH14292.1 nucleotide-diphosphate-sugar epimerase [Amycolatopsis oliviviridis]
MILVTGAGGNVGSELTAILTRDGHSVRALVRTPRPLPDGVEGVMGDLNEPTSLKTALEGVRAVFLLGGYDDMSGALAVMRGAGVEQVTLLSSRSVVGGRPDNAVAGMHMAAEAAVRASKLAWTFLRPSGFMSNTLQWIPQLQAGDVVREPFANVPVATIDPYDIAAVAAESLTTPGHEGRAYAITGPGSLRPADRLRVLSELLGRKLRLEPLPDAEARVTMSAEMPEKYVDAFFRFFAEGEFDDSVVTGAVQDLTGREPRPFAIWARTHLAAFR